MFLSVTNHNGLPILPSVVRCGNIPIVSLSTQGLLGGLDSFATRSGTRLQCILGTSNSPSSTSSSPSTSSMISFNSITCPTDSSMYATFTLFCNDNDATRLGENSYEQEINAKERLQILQSLLICWIGTTDWWKLCEDPSFFLSSDRKKARHIQSIYPVLVSIMQNGYKQFKEKNIFASTLSLRYFIYPNPSFSSSLSTSTLPHIRINLLPSKPFLKTSSSTPSSSLSSPSTSSLLDNEWNIDDPQILLDLFIQEIAAITRIPYVSLYITNTNSNSNETTNKEDEDTDEDTDEDDDDICPIATTFGVSKVFDSRSISLALLLSRLFPTKKTVFNCFLRTTMTSNTSSVISSKSDNKEIQTNIPTEEQVSVLRVSFLLVYNKELKTIQFDLTEKNNKRLDNVIEGNNSTSFFKYTLLFLSPNPVGDTQDSLNSENFSPLSYKTCLQAIYDTLDRMKTTPELLYALFASFACAQESHSKLFSTSRNRVLINKKDMNESTSRTRLSHLYSPSPSPSKHSLPFISRLYPPIITAELNTSLNQILFSQVNLFDHRVIKEALLLGVESTDIINATRHVFAIILCGIDKVQTIQQTPNNDEINSTTILTSTGDNSSSLSSSSSSPFSFSLSPTTTTTKVLTQDVFYPCATHDVQFHFEILASSCGKWARAFLRNFEKKRTLE
jgi:hypothetical protein